MADRDFDTLDEDAWKEVEEQDEALFSRLMNQPPEAETGLIDLDRPLEIGEKADDALDYEDISDDGDLPEEEEASGNREDEAPGLTDDQELDDDLFGEGPSSPADVPDNSYDGYADSSMPEKDENGGALGPTLTMQQLTALNFPAADEAPDTATYNEELFKTLWPSFEKGKILNFATELLPQKRAQFVPKAPVKPPKPLNLTKVSLDIAPDQEKSFHTAGPATVDKRKRVLEAEARGLIAIVEESSDEGEDEDCFDYSYPTDTVGGKTLMDLQIICDDWDSIIERVPEDTAEEVEDELMDEWDREFLGHSSKRKHDTIAADDDFLDAPVFPIPSFDNFEEMVNQTAKRVVLDLNDPHLLVDIQEYNPAAKRRRLGLAGESKRVGNGSFASELARRFNYSNDEAYNALKENHQSKIRATVGNLSVEHSMPALKLGYPFYKVKLLPHDARTLHRPSMNFGRNIARPVEFSRPGMRKRKSVKGMPIIEIFAENKDLSLNDYYASATLLEYSEEHPFVLSNFGMGNRIINYYRRKNAEDTERPQPEDKIGDTQVLLPEDRSPFANFGTVDPGTIVRTIHNAMYRAPIFRHEPKKTDFLIIESRTGLGGSTWGIRNIDNLFVVGQQFPSVQIPGPHSRKVTNAAKTRMKMVAYRMMKHSNNKNMDCEEYTKHIPDSTVSQNRQKLKDFLQYDKTVKKWKMREGEQLPDEPTIRNMITPEDVCVLDSMQVGSRYLEDTGVVITSKGAAANNDDDDEGDEEGMASGEALAPWRTSKAFLEASAEKAMLQLRGAGDPTGRGLGFSLIRTSMKGGFLDTLQGSSKDAGQKSKNGHGYNVKLQNQIYNETINSIWNAQRKNLADPDEHDEDVLDEDNDYAQSAPTPAPYDDSMSVMSRQNRVMEITRTRVNDFGQEYQEKEVIKDPRVWRQYERKRRELEAAGEDIFSAEFTGEKEKDGQTLNSINYELNRLTRNKDRRLAREKQGKGNRGRKGTIEPVNPGSPSANVTQSIEKPVGTSRKCANCGQTGHIKTNKKLCPMLNGTMKQEDLAMNTGGFGAIQPPSFTS